MEKIGTEPKRVLTPEEVDMRNKAQAAAIFEHWDEIVKAMDSSRIYDRESSDDRTAVFLFLMKQKILQDFSDQYDPDNPEKPLVLDHSKLYARELGEAA